MFFGSFFHLVYDISAHQRKWETCFRHKIQDLFKKLTYKYHLWITYSFFSIFFLCCRCLTWNSSVYFWGIFLSLVCLFLIIDIGIQKRNQEYTHLVSLRNTILEAFVPENTAMWPPELLILLMLLAPGVHGKCSWFCGTL